MSIFNTKISLTNEINKAINRARGYVGDPPPLSEQTKKEQEALVQAQQQYFNDIENLSNRRTAQLTMENANFKQPYIPNLLEKKHPKYYDSTPGDSREDLSKGQQKEKLTIKHVPTGQEIRFAAFLTNWNDTFTQEWSPTSVIGRMDTIQTFKRTGRKISFAWDVPSTDEDMAANNYVNAAKLMSMNYPVFHEIKYNSYSSVNLSANINANSAAAESIEAISKSENERKATEKTVGIMTSPPIFNINFGMWADNLYGTIDSISFNPKFNGEDNGFWFKGDYIIPKTLSFSCNFTVIHAKPLGWNTAGELRDPNFPYG